MYDLKVEIEGKKVIYFVTFYLIKNLTFFQCVKQTAQSDIKMFKKCKLVLICLWCWIWILHCVHFNYKKIVINCHILTNIGYFTSFLFVLEYCKQYEAKSKIFVGINFYWFLKLCLNSSHTRIFPSYPNNYVPFNINHTTVIDLATAA